MTIPIHRLIDMFNDKVEYFEGRMMNVSDDQYKAKGRQYVDELLKFIKHLDKIQLETNIALSAANNSGSINRINALLEEIQELKEELKITPKNRVSDTQFLLDEIDRYNRDIAIIRRNQRDKPDNEVRDYLRYKEREIEDARSYMRDMIEMFTQTYAR